MAEELIVKGIITSVAPHREYGRRVSLITDTLGRITAFAGNAAKAGSKLTGSVRPMTCARFTLSRGRSAYNLRSVEIIDAFGELALEFDRSVYAAYVLETGEYFSDEGMPEEESKHLLNLMYVTLRALRDGKPEAELVRRIYELRLLMLQGEYTQSPSSSASPETAEIWQRCIVSPLSALYDAGYYAEKDCGEFALSVERLFLRQINHSFRSLGILRDLR